MRKRGRYEAQKPKKKGSKVVLIILCVLLLLLGGIGVEGVMVYNDFINRIEYVEEVENTGPLSEDILAMMGTEPSTQATEPTVVETTVAVEETTIPTEPTEPKIPEIINVMLIGQSYRKGEENYLSDTLILVSINKDSKEVTLTSFPRDTWVDLPDYKSHTCGWNLINTNYALGYNFGGTAAAMTMINNCLKINFGIEVDYDIEVSLEAFPAIIDALGGVRIELTQAEADYINDVGFEWVETLTEGENRLFGEEALEYARMRKAEGDSDSDLVRTERQRKLLTALFDKVRTKSLKELRDIAYEILPLIKTNMTNEQITECLLDVLPLLADMTISSGTCPASGTAWPEDKDVPGVGMRSVMVFSSEQQKRLMMPITEGYAP
jgi:LCP family protein required for cell wall assembly